MGRSAETQLSDRNSTTRPATTCQWSRIGQVYRVVSGGVVIDVVKLGEVEADLAVGMEHLSVWEPGDEPAVGTKDVLPVAHIVARHRLVVPVGCSGRGVLGCIRDKDSSIGSRDPLKTGASNPALSTQECCGPGQAAFLWRKMPAHSRPA
jgi:hypothetical protein